jgi:hypothetical protein
MLLFCSHQEISLNTAYRYLTLTIIQIVTLLIEVPKKIKPKTDFGLKIQDYRIAWHDWKASSFVQIND